MEQGPTLLHVASDRPGLHFPSLPCMWGEARGDSMLLVLHVEGLARRFITHSAQACTISNCKEEQGACQSNK